MAPQTLTGQLGHRVTRSGNSTPLQQPQHHIRRLQCPQQPRRGHKKSSLSLFLWRERPVFSEVHSEPQPPSHKLALKTSLLSPALSRGSQGSGSNLKRGQHVNRTRGSGLLGAHFPSWSASSSSALTVKLLDHLNCHKHFEKVGCPMVATAVTDVPPWSLTLLASSATLAMLPVETRARELRAVCKPSFPPQPAWLLPDTSATVTFPQRGTPFPSGPHLSSIRAGGPRHLRPPCT